MGLLGPVVQRQLLPTANLDPSLKPLSRASSVRRPQLGDLGIGAASEGGVVERTEGERRGKDPHASTWGLDVPSVSRDDKVERVGSLVTGAGLEPATCG